MKTFYLTDKGKVRDHNEDSVTIIKNDSGEYLMIVADGMGGHRAGEVASSMVVTHLGSRFASIHSVGSKLDAVNWLNSNITEINENIIKYAESNKDSQGMGTTVVLALLTSEFLMFGNIGDSSGFVIKNGKIHKVTKDHTLVNLLVAAGDLTPEEALFHPKKNVLMKALGAGEKGCWATILLRENRSWSGWEGMVPWPSWAPVTIPKDVMPDCRKASSWNP